MKRLLLPLLAALALPTAVNADDTHWLLLKRSEAGSRGYQWQMPTDSELECERAIQKIKNTSWWNDRSHAICLPGK